MKFTIISASLSPNAKTDDVLLAFRTLIAPWTWRYGSKTGSIESWFSERYPSYSAFTGNSARGLLYEALQAFGIGEGDEVLLQAFTCVAVPNSIVWTGATPVWVDCDDRLNFDSTKAQKMVNRRTKAIIVQHTFGIPADMKQILKFAKKNTLLVIEDCAHGLGASYQDKPLGSFGDAAVFSFGRDKVVSGVFGGAAIIRSSHAQNVNAMKTFHRGIGMPSMFWIFQQILHPLAFSLILPLYRMGIGKLILVVLQKLNLLSFPVYRMEKYAKKPTDFPRQLPNALANLALHQLKKLSGFTETRRAVAELYMRTLKTFRAFTCFSNFEGSAYLRFPLLTDDPDNLRVFAKKHGILLGNWYQHTIDPKGVDFTAVSYAPGSCPNAERIAARIVNLPTNISMLDAQRVISVLEEYNAKKQK